MMPTRRTFASIACLTALLGLLHAGPSSAGPAEDYADGSKRYAQGDLIAAMPLLQRAADAGHAAAQAALAEIFDQSDNSTDAAEYFRKSALQGNADGQFGLGALLAAGQGTPKNLAEARKWIQLAAEQGQKLAINELALAYMNGGLDLPDEARRSPEALRWIMAAADNDYLTAMERLAAAYRSGELGLRVDAKAAAQWDARVNKARGTRQGRRNKKGASGNE